MLVKINDMHNQNTDKEKLAKRIETHERYSKYDINEWIFGILKIKDTESVLDIGCGTGKQLIPIVEKTKGLVVGVDVSKESLAHIKSSVGNKNPNIMLILSSMEDVWALAPQRLKGILLSSTGMWVWAHGRRGLCWK